MVELGDHAAHLELVFDPQTGRLTLYVLDGEGTGPIRLNQPHVTLVVGTENEPVFVTLDAAGRVLTGERVGDSSEFRAVAPALVGATSLDARVETVTVRGQTYDNIGIAWRAP
jgi:hypothetical protein